MPSYVSSSNVHGTKIDSWSRDATSSSIIAYSIPRLHLYFCSFPLPLPDIVSFVPPLHDHVHVLMWMHSTQFGSQLLGLHWSSSFEFIDQVFGFYCKGCQRVYLRDLFGFCGQGLPRVVAELWLLGFIKHGITGEVKDDGRHGKEGQEIGIGSRARTMAGAGPTDLL